MSKKSREKIKEMEKRIIQAETDKISSPYKENEYNAIIKENYAEISKTIKESRNREKERNIIIGAGLLIISLFVLVLASQNFASQNLIDDLDISITSFGVYSPEEDVSDAFYDKIHAKALETNESIVNIMIDSLVQDESG